MTTATVTARDFMSPIKPTWCPGCGDFAVWSAIKNALTALNIAPTKVVLCFDIGCNGNMADKINAYVFKGLHGRVIPVAAGIALANKDLPVIAVGGDGGTFDEGVNHLIHAIRSNYNMTFILHNNCDFGLTTGQATPTTPKGQKMNSSPYGVVEDRLNPTQFALNLDASFVARGFSADQAQLNDLLTKAIQHKGFSYLEVLQHCPTYNQFMNQDWYRERVYKVEETEGYSTGDKMKAYQTVDYSQEKIATGVLYEKKESDAPDFLSRKAEQVDNSKPLTEQVQKVDVSGLMASFK